MDADGEVDAADRDGGLPDEGAEGVARDRGGKRRLVAADAVDLDVLYGSRCPLRDRSDEKLVLGRVRVRVVTGGRVGRDTRQGSVRPFPPELGRSGVADLINRSCVHASRMAELLTAGGARVYNEVVLNQVLVGFGDLSRTDAVVEAVQRDGTCWLGATTWRGERLIRISVSNWTTTESDIDLSADAILRAAASVRADGADPP